ncbi:DEAD/DEAH box helicase [Tahibacter amnicola]|uniref:DEAD/DEAH box helicase n=1 Tax=Tahibacter amnicola TaxID=2976241 RepID=A0ABY6B8F5_9GAMM|nr:DEAD/DEAH box helicase [Tahibacter amnicola]UXI66363.1 DEAD/DEAH box helicase [Tahibacter amnicola]
MHAASLDAFHPAVSAWFRSTFPAPTPAQCEAWEAIAGGQHTLVAAPTGSGKTLAAFLAAIDELVRQGVENPLPDETVVVYVSPLKALSNDIRVNLEAPLAGIREELARRGDPDVEIRTAVRTGDTPDSERERMRRKPPHILVTTPESLYVLLGSESGRRVLASTRSVIVDEIHALAPNKRGSHLALSLARLESLAGRPLLRIGLSATQQPIQEVARFLVGSKAIDAEGNATCRIVDRGYSRERDLAIELPDAPLEAVMSGDAWSQVYARLAALVRAHRTTLVFVNTRRMAERAARHLSEELGHERVAAHHGSLSRDHRLEVEQRLKRGDLAVLVATASLELGIDIGDVELVCQLGSPRAISTFLQRVGRSGHAVGGTPKGRLFPQSRDDLMECTALLDAVRRGELDTLQIPPQPIDVLAQQIVAEVACGDCQEDTLYALTCSAYPYRSLSRDEFDAVVRMLAEGFANRRGAREALLHRDAVNGELHARRASRLTAITSGGAIPDTADYDVVLEPASVRIGSVHEDFAVESLAGDVFQLGNASYRILRVERGRLRVEDAQGQPPSIPFWLGEAPGRTDALSTAVSRLRETLNHLLTDDATAAGRHLVEAIGLDEAAALQLADYLGRSREALGTLPTMREIVMERFFDESGGTQLVIHSPLGSRINRAWGLALRKRFCRKFNFELQAAATEDAIVLSLSTSHSFPLEDVARYLHSASVRDVLTQAVLDAPLFGVRWRWVATTSLALPRFLGGSRVAPQLQRMKSEDLLATVFPDQVACAENLVGEREIPDHPLVAQTLYDCLHEAMDLDGLVTLLRQLERGEARVIARDLPAPSPLAAEILSARPYAFLDDAPLEERRTQAVQARRWRNPESAEEIGQLDAEAIRGVVTEAWPDARDAEELHHALQMLTFLTAEEVRAQAGWPAFAEALIQRHRAAWLERPGVPSPLLVPSERIPLLRGVFGNWEPPHSRHLPAEFSGAAPEDEALTEIIRGRLSGLGPVTAASLGYPLGLPAEMVLTGLLRLENEGYVIRGRFSADHEQWCERHLLARIHRYTVARLRREIEPVEPRDFLRFLFDWQHVSPQSRLEGPDAVAAVLAQLEGFEAGAGQWEGELLPARINGYEIAWLDDLCRAGRVVWARLRAMADKSHGRGGPLRTTPISLLQRRQLPLWKLLAPPPDESAPLSSRAEAVLSHLTSHGASFFEEIQDATRLLRTEVEDALGELVATGRINADSFAGLRALLAPAAKKASPLRRRQRPSWMGVEDAGRWALVRSAPAADNSQARTEAIEHAARTLLRRYGVVFWRLTEREADWLPPWRELLRVYHRLEARGEIRGGRFVSGFTGEQFALPEAVAALRAVRKRPHDGTTVVVAGADPLNLVGAVTPGERVPAVAGSRVLYRDGIPIAIHAGGSLRVLAASPGESETELKRQLLRDPRQPPATVGALPSTRRTSARPPASPDAQLGAGRVVK